MSVIHTVYARTDLTPKEFLLLFLDCLPDEAKKNGVELVDTTDRLCGIIEGFSFTPDVIFSIDSFSIRLAAILGFMPTVTIGAKLRAYYSDEDVDPYYFQTAFELIRRENLDLALDYFDRLILVNCSGKLAVSKDDIDRINEAMGKNPIPYDLKDFSEY